MDLKEVQALRLQARKNQDKIRYNILTLLAGEMETRLKGPEADRASVEAIARKLIKSNNESLAVRDDERLLEENAVLEELLPNQLTEAELESIIISVAGKEGANVGTVMKHLNQQFPDQFDRKRASEIAKEAL